MAPLISFWPRCWLFFQVFMMEIGQMLFSKFETCIGDEANDTMIIAKPQKTTCNVSNVQWVKWIYWELVWSAIKRIIVFLEGLVCIFCVNPTFLNVIPLYQCSLGVFPPSWPKFWSWHANNVNDEVHFLKLNHCKAPKTWHFQAKTNYIFHFCTSQNRNPIPLIMAMSSNSN